MDEVENLEATVVEPPVVEDDGEPGGKDPKEIARRIEYGKRKAAEKRAEDAERRAIAAEERAKVLAEQQEAKAAQPAEKIYTAEEVQELIDSGKLKPALGYQYLAKIAAESAFAAEKQRRAVLAPIEQSRAEMGEWVEIMPALLAEGSPEKAKADVELAKLIKRGFVDTWATRLTAIEKAHGSLDVLRKKAEMRELTRTTGRLPVDGGGGTASDVKPKAGDISKAPPEMVKYWEANVMSQKDREGHFKLWQANQAKKAS